MPEFFKSIIPGLPNRLVAGALDFLCFFSIIPKRKRKKHLESNPEHVFDGFIESQSELKDMRFGSTDMAYAGCEIIAVYNLLKAAGINKELSALIYRFERRGAVLNGRFGTSPYALYRYLKKEGLDAVRSIRRKDFDKIASECSSFIITMYNDSKNIFEQVHTVCVTKDEEGKLVMHNCGRRDVHYESLEALEKGAGKEGRARIFFIAGIPEKKQMGE